MTEDSDLRDMFAMSAMQALITGGSPVSSEHLDYIAHTSYAVADAMMHYRRSPEDTDKGIADGQSEERKKFGDLLDWETRRNHDPLDD